MAQLTPFPQADAAIDGSGGDTVATPRALRAASSLAGAVVVGVALGFGSQILQGWLPGDSGVLANSGVVWALVALGIGLTERSARSASIGGALALVVASFSYYVSADWFEGTGFSLRAPLVWSVAGVAAGSMLGLAGFVARRSATHRSSAWALVAGVVLGEGVHLTWFVGNEQLRPAGLAELAIAAFIAAICPWRSASVKFVIAMVPAGAVATLLAIRLIDEVFAAW